MKEKFYVFLDIDGVLWDWKYIKALTSEGKREKGGAISEFSPDSIDALNHLILSLNNNYEVDIVISSARRKINDDMTELVGLLKACGVKYNKPYQRTSISNTNKRGVEILDYLNKHNEKNNYLVIDDDSYDIVDYIPKDKLIKTDIFDGRLKKTRIEDFLHTINLSSNKSL